MLIFQKYKRLIRQLLWMCFFSETAVGSTIQLNKKIKIIKQIYITIDFHSAGRNIFWKAFLTDKFDLWVVVLRDWH